MPLKPHEARTLHISPVLGERLNQQPRRSRWMLNQFGLTVDSTGPYLLYGVLPFLFLICIVVTISVFVVKSAEQQNASSGFLTVIVSIFMVLVMITVALYYRFPKAKTEMPKARWWKKSDLENQTIERAAEVSNGAVAASQNLPYLKERSIPGFQNPNQLPNPEATREKACKSDPNQSNLFCPNSVLPRTEKHPNPESSRPTVQYAEPGASHPAAAEAMHEEFWPRPSILERIEPNKTSRSLPREFVTPDPRFGSASLPDTLMIGSHHAHGYGNEPPISAGEPAVVNPKAKSDSESSNHRSIVRHGSSNTGETRKGWLRSPPQPNPRRRKSVTHPVKYAEVKRPEVEHHKINIEPVENSSEPPNLRISFELEDTSLPATPHVLLSA